MTKIVGAMHPLVESCHVGLEEQRRRRLQQAVLSHVHVPSTASFSLFKSPLQFRRCILRLVVHFILNSLSLSFFKMLFSLPVEIPLRA